MPVHRHHHDGHQRVHYGGDLQELGHLKSFLGTTIVSAAVIDDVIGIVVLTCVLGASSGTGTGLGKVLINTVLFFATAVGVGVWLTLL